jgi:hypothetical protein
VRCDNPGENNTLEARSQIKYWRLNLEFDYTTRDTHQQNSLAETIIVNMKNLGRALMNSSNVPKELRFKIWRESFQVATNLDGFSAIVLDGKLATRYEYWRGSNHNFAKHLSIWEATGTIKIKTDTSPKLNDKGVQCMFCGYAKNRKGECCRIWNLINGYICMTCNII